MGALSGYKPNHTQSIHAFFRRRPAEATPTGTPESSPRAPKTEVATPAGGAKEDHPTDADSPSSAFSFEQFEQEQIEFASDDDSGGEEDPSHCTIMTSNNPLNQTSIR